MRTLFTLNLLCKLYHLKGILGNLVYVEIPPLTSLNAELRKFDLKLFSRSLMRQSGTFSWLLCENSTSEFAFRLDSYGYLHY